DWITKPVDRQKLVEALANHLDESDMADRNPLDEVDWTPEDELRELFIQACEHNNVDQLRKLSEQLLTRARELDSKELLKFAKSLNKRVNNFKIKGVERKLDQFREAFM
ncbi:MAG: hypothetical protein ABEK50_18245, partial [bacterium]